MKLSIEERTIERCGVSNERAFNIKGSAKAFKILSSGLYRDKILAIVRELSTNAYDAHVAARRVSVPFDVHLPNALEPFFSIKDYGVGLSHEDVLHIYTTYFESTKTNSNDFVGALGLGSKSPFSYVDTYTVISRFHGEKSTYALFIDESGWPNVTRLTVEATDEENGVEVIIPVEKSSDFSEFRYRAEQVYRTFSPSPTITGQAHFSLPERKVLIEGDGYRLYDARDSACALMGLIAYPVSTDSLGYSQTPERVTARIVYSLPIDIDFSIGDLDFTAGREELSYDERTIDALIARAQDVLVDLRDRVEKRFEACATEYEARKLYGALYGNGYGPLGRVLGASDIKWRDKSISRSFDVKLKHLSHKSVTIKTFSTGSRGISVNTASGFRGDSLYISASENVFVVRDDLPRGAIARVRHAMNKHATYHLISGESEEVDAVIEQLDGFPVILASDLDKPASAPRASSGGKATISILPRMARYASFEYHRDLLEPVTVDVEDGGLMIKTFHGKPEGFKSATDFDNACKALHKCGLFDPTTEPVYFVPSSLSKGLTDDNGWESFLEVMKARAEAHIAASNLSEMMGTHKACENLTYTHANFLRLFERLVEHGGFDQHAINTVVEKNFEIKTLQPKVVGLLNLASAFEINVTANAGLNLSDMIDTIVNGYPMLKLLGNPCYDDIEIIANYIRDLDARA